ncbi:MAG TPA: FtsX-like permease family protein, partial [Planctomycetaceae bacterium]
MTRTSLLVKTLAYHWRSNLAVWLGVVAGTAVIGGALIVGDSVRGSLREMTLARLGIVDYALTGPRFITERLAQSIESDPVADEKKVFAAILLTVSIEKRVTGEAQATTRAGRVNLIAFDTESSPFFVEGGPPLQGEELSVNDQLARDLEVEPGDSVLLSVELPADIPRDALLGKRNETVVEIPLTVRTVLGERASGARFGLRPDQQMPSNAFVSLKLLRERLGLTGETGRGRDRRTGSPRVNTIFISVPEEGQGPDASAEFNQILHNHWQLDDLHLRIAANEKLQYLSLESERMILDRQTAKAAHEVAQELGCSISPVLAYITNEISLVGIDDADRAEKDPKYSRYSIVAGLDPALFAADTKPPFGPFQFESPADPPMLAEGDINRPEGIGEIILNDWLAQDIGAKVGDIVRLTYYVVGSHGELPEEERQFKVRGIVALEGVAADRGLIPEVHGITDVNSFDEWDAPFPMKKVTPRDEAYWPKYRATPKAFVTLKTAQHLWQSRYGDLTSLRIAPVSGKTLDESRELLTAALLKQLKPEEMGLIFQPVKSQGLQAASGTTDFGGLFIGFSFFLILSAMILIGLLFRLGIERRSANVGLLLATGFSQKQVRRLLLGEGLAIVAAGGIAGVLAAVAYAALIVHCLKTWWIGAIGTRFLNLFIEPASLATGLAISVFAAVIAIWWGIRSLWKISPRGLLAGVTQPPTRAHEQHRQSRKAFR